MSRLVCYRLCLLLMIVSEAWCWHDFSHVDYHCWPLTASVNNPTSYGACPGIAMRWVEEPPDSIRAERHFNVTFEMILHEQFWEWGVVEDFSGGSIKNNFFSAMGITTPAAAQEWCTSTACPGHLEHVDISNCCIHHVNIHSCPLDTTDYCGPWIQPQGQVYTHSDVMWGSPNRARWTSLVKGLYKEGTTQMIAHVRLADMQIALYKNVFVLPQTECGDNLCEAEEGESCSSCPADCGRCPLKDWQIALCALAGVAVICAILVTAGYFHWKQQKLFWDESWIIKYSHLQRCEHAAKSMLSLKGTGSVKSRADLTSLSSASGTLQQTMTTRQVFTQIALCQGKIVAVRKITKKQFSLTKAIRKEVKRIRGLDHPNLCQFVGACIEVPDVCVLMLYCPKGGLNDILLNNDIPLTWGFRFSFATDIARALRYLHSHKMYHSRLKSANCLVDDRWTVKVTDYGLPLLRKEDPASALDLCKESKAKVYLPPEGACDNLSSGQQGAADVYAFGIILVEIASRIEPFPDCMEQTPDDPHKSSTCWRPPLPDFSDQTKENQCPRPELYTRLIEQCWQDDPQSRPTFEQIRRSLQIINTEKNSPVDMMMMMMEKYSKHLEHLVGERTQDLLLEKQKTDRLLHSMLPESVANHLRQGKAIDAQQFSSCTIYFSDIVGFTSLSAHSSPLQVVALLNKLYTCFDSILEKYDVYKVETIGDAYMVVSGVPAMNGDCHGREIACMSLDLVAASRSFVIPHMPAEPLKIRAGVHSGPVCAGVVGIQMPRYCLFGDTVNTASRMESNGEAYKVHISSATHKILDKLGGFTFESRGAITVKGKGEVETWWLLGKEPDDSAVSEVQPLILK